MAKRGGSESHEGGVKIGGNARVNVGGNIVGRDYIQGADAQAMDAHFQRLLSAVHQERALSASERQGLADTAGDLQHQLAQPEPDLGKVQQSKSTLLARGGQIAAATAAIFNYGPVQEVIKSAAQRLIGG